MNVDQRTFEARDSFKRKSLIRFKLGKCDIMSNKPWKPKKGSKTVKGGNSTIIDEMFEAKEMQKHEKETRCSVMFC